MDSKIIIAALLALAACGPVPSYRHEPVDRVAREPLPVAAAQPGRVGFPADRPRPDFPAPGEPPRDFPDGHGDPPHPGAGPDSRSH